MSDEINFFDRNGGDLRLRLFELSYPYGASLVEAQLDDVHVKWWGHDKETYVASASGHQYGTETSNDNGHVEGAIKAGERAANEVLASLAKAKMAAGAGRQP
eukprot:gene17840-30951_t